MQCLRPAWIKEQDMFVPCGTCKGCRLAKTREWSTRLVQELPYWEDSMFITLTFDEDNVPKDYSIRKRDLQLFFKRMRRRTGKDFKYYACGEYGEKDSRPHYHCILFGIGRNDIGIEKSLGGNRFYIKDWRKPRRVEEYYGFVHIGSVTYNSARYVANYFKKGLSQDRFPGQEVPFVICSKGIGEKFVKEFMDDLIRNNGFYLKGKKLGLPKYYMDKIGKIDKFGSIILKEKRIEKVAEWIDKKNEELKEFDNEEGYKKILEERYSKVLKAKKLEEIKASG